MVVLLYILPLVLLFVIGLILTANNNKKAAKIFFIIAGIYLLIGLGTCGYLLFAIS